MIEKIEREAKHTAGPWICDGYYTSGSFSEIRMNGIRIARMLPASGNSPSQEEQEANARLIAAAPALLAACEYCHNLLCNGVGQATHAVAMLEDVFQKAKKGA